ncbi:MAG: hypothetical protein HOI09_05070 [Porticoccaceae bacterium]|jgi:predicted DNA-binding transcriptional regulator AlpA|nr:hypothetical protein [Porticoccaceae bacterium]
MLIDSSDRYITIKEVSAKLGLDKPIIYARVQAGKWNDWPKGSPCWLSVGLYSATL